MGDSIVLCGRDISGAASRTGRGLGVSSSSGSSSGFGSCSGVEGDPDDSSVFDLMFCIDEVSLSGRGAVSESRNEAEMKGNA